MADTQVIDLQKNKRSAVAEMGDRFSTIDMNRNDIGRKGGRAAVPLSVESWVPI